MPKLTADEVDAFLREPGHLVRVATVDDDGMPRNVPLWFILHDDQIVFTPRVHSVLLANIRRDPRVGLTIDEEALPYRKLTVQGHVEILHEPGNDDVWRDLYLDIAMRYVPEEGARAYVTGTDDQPRALLGVRPGRRQAVDVADAGGRRGRHRHLGPSVLPRRHEDGSHRRRRLIGLAPNKMR